MIVFVVVFSIVETVLGSIFLSNVSARILILDNNSRPLLLKDMCVGIQSFATREEAKQCGTINYNPALGRSGMRKGEYALYVWLGDLERIDRLIHSQKINLTKLGQEVSIVIPNVSQEIKVLITDQAIPQLIGSNITVEIYRP